MKKLTLIVAMFFVTTFAFSQTPLTEAVDLPGTDTHGDEYNLSENLDGGGEYCIPVPTVAMVMGLPTLCLQGSKTWRQDVAPVAMATLRI